MANPSNSPNAFVEVATIRDPDGLLCVITEKPAPPGGRSMHSFTIVKEYERDGKILRTGFMNRRHVDAARRLLEQAAAWLDAEVDRATARRAPIAAGTNPRAPRVP